MTYIFDGREFAKRRLELLKDKVRQLNLKGITPKMDSILVGEDPASLMYLGLKKKRGSEIGVEIRIKQFPPDIKKSDLTKEIEKLNGYKSVNGIMIQLPMPSNFTKEDTREIISHITPIKDVDGLREGSGYVAPTAKAATLALEEAVKSLNLNTGNTPLKVIVIGVTGFEGSKIYEILSADRRFNVKGANSKTQNLEEEIKDSDAVISVTGKTDLIKKEMIKEGSILIDVGAPYGDIEKAAYQKASFVSPVPGGVGPITIACLLENLVEAVNK